MAQTQVRPEQILGLNNKNTEQDGRLTTVENKLTLYQAPSMTISKIAPSSPGANAVWVDMN